MTQRPIAHRVRRMDAAKYFTVEVSGHNYRGFWLRVQRVGEGSDCLCIFSEQTWLNGNGDLNYHTRLP
jgi:hypothetical protein